jgi:DNA-binding transcriptional MerR regulator/effector-binding domain-containing protein
MFLTGEFSRIARVSKRQLQYYDEIGLLHPAHTDPQTGYRYYSAKQLPCLNRILAMKDLGLTLDQIRRMLDDDVSTDEVYGMLLMQRAELEKKLLDDMDRFRRVESRLRTYVKDAPQLPDVVMKSVPKVEILSADYLLTTPDKGWIFVHQLFQNLPEHVDMRNLGHFMITVSVDEFLAENTHVEFGFMVAGDIPDTVTLTDDIVLNKRNLPAVPQMATVAHIGHPQTANIPYGELGTWIETNGYQMNGYQREVFIEFPISGNPDDTVMELQIPVNKADTDPLLPPLKIES